MTSCHRNLHIDLPRIRESTSPMARTPVPSTTTRGTRSQDASVCRRAPRVTLAGVIAVADEEEFAQGADFSAGAMIELPRTCMIADGIARHADVIAFGWRRLRELLTVSHTDRRRRGGSRGPPRQQIPDP